LLGLNLRHTWFVRVCHQALAGFFRQLNAFTGLLWARFKPLRFLSARLGMRFVRRLVEMTYANKGVQLEIPPGWR
jgi:hypothetical protein